MTAIACIFIEILNQLLAYNAQYTLSFAPVFTQQETILFNRIINNNKPWNVWACLFLRRPSPNVQMSRSNNRQDLHSHLK
jgi:hypothetical protein